jgi:hypothetical protein
MASESDIAIRFGKGRERRLIDLRREDARRVIGWLEDDFHHFGLTVTHDGQRITAVSATAERFPYDTCAGATLPLTAIVGAPLFERCSDVGSWINMRLQCTHLFDLAGLVIAHAWSGREHRRYEGTVEDREVEHENERERRRFGRGSARLLMDGREVLFWELDNQTITGPGSWVGQSLGAGFRERTEGMGTLAAEHATVLRRITLIANGRSKARFGRTPEIDRDRPALCHSFQPAQLAVARKKPGSLRDWQDSADGMLARLRQVP